jgi:hypothetical protein
MIQAGPYQISCGSCQSRFRETRKMSLECRLLFCRHCGGFDLCGDQITDRVSVQFDSEDVEDGRKATIIR